MIKWLEDAFSIAVGIAIYELVKYILVSIFKKKK